MPIVCAGIGPFFFCTALKETGRIESDGMESATTGPPTILRLTPGGANDPNEPLQKEATCVFDATFVSSIC